VKVFSSASAGGGGGNEALPWIDFAERAPSGILLLACETQMESKSRFFVPRNVCDESFGKCLTLELDSITQRSRNKDCRRYAGIRHCF
jgi:hypothetical protein